MSLQMYSADYSLLSAAEREALFDRIAKRTEDGGRYIRGEDRIEFCLKTEDPLDILELPETCRVTMLA